MSWNTPVWGTISPGVIVTPIYDWGGADKGVQLALAHPFNPGANLDTIFQGKGQYGGGGIFYTVRFVNNGSLATAWMLEGGGVV
jgi:hypothetical protein